jgi:hypothetical protein
VYIESRKGKLVRSVESRKGEECRKQGMSGEIK